ncbi:MAG: DegT/DnrJ/EryC1/StrS family aminotransferase [Candidatus Aminicenantales bacterium]
MIPFLNLQAQYERIKDEINTKVLEIISAQEFVLGQEVESLEQEVASYSGVKYGIGVSSGTDALIISLMALGIEEGEGVVTSPFTFFATAGSIARLKARPLFCDIEEKSFNLSPLKLEEFLREEVEKRGKTRIKAIIPVHLFGQCAEMDPILSLGKKYNIPVVEDACQSIGAEYPSEEGVKKASAMGKAGTLSFFPSKNLGGYGDGGMVLTDDSDFARKLKLLRVHGSKDAYIYEFIGGNFRLDALQAAVLRIKLRYVEKWNKERMARAEYYEQRFKDRGLLDEGFITLPQALYKKKVANYHVYHQYVIRARRRDALKDYLEKNGVASAVYYPLPLHLQKCFSFLNYKKGDFPQSEKASEEVLALPIYPELGSDEQEYIISLIYDFYHK